MRQVMIHLVIAMVLLSCELQAAVWTDTFDTPEGPIIPTAAGTTIGNWNIWEQSYTVQPYSYEIHNGYMDALSLNTGSSLYSAHITKNGFTDGITAFSVDEAYKAVGTSTTYGTYSLQTLLFANPIYYLTARIQGAKAGTYYALTLEWNLPTGGAGSLDVADVISQSDNFLSYQFVKTDDTTWSWYYTDPSSQTQVLLGSKTSADFADAAVTGVQLYSKSTASSGNNFGKHMLFDNVSVTTIPEPSTMGLLLLGAAFTYFRKRVSR